MRKATLGMERAEKLALIEAWSSGELDFTLHDFSVGDDGHTTHIAFKDAQSLLMALDKYYAEFKA